MLVVHAREAVICIVGFHAWVSFCGCRLTVCGVRTIGFEVFAHLQRELITAFSARQ